MDLTVKIEICLSEDTKKYLDGLIGVKATPEKQTPAPAPAARPQAPAQTPAPAPAAKPQASAPAPAPAAKPQAPAPAPAPRPQAQAPNPTIEPAAKQTSKVDIVALRKELSLKVNDNREAIKAKLTEYGASSISVLAEEHYDSLMKFLISL